MKPFLGRTALLLLLPSALRAVELAEIFRDHMVLQREVKVCIWGTGQPGEKIALAFAGQQSEAVADGRGKWRGYFTPMPASADGRSLVVRGGNTIEVRDVLVGEVWLAGGQSNMGSRMREYEETIGPEFLRANYPDFRVFTVNQRAVVSDSPSTAGWTPVTPASVAGISATAYFFGRNLHRHLGVPVGIVVCAWGGTLAENWMSRTTLLSHSETRPIAERYEAIASSYGSEAAYQSRLAAHRLEQERWKEQRKIAGKGAPAPKEPMGPRHFQRPAGLYESMFRPLVPYTFRGIVFYQGESNVADGRSYQYRYLLPLLVREWRRDLEANLPFLNVQLPVIKGQLNDEWAEMRESQAVAVRAVEGCELAVVLEYGEYNRLHPHGKEGVGARLAMLALGAVYGEPIVCRGPILSGHRVEGNRVILEFDETGSGLEAPGGELKDFTIAGEDGEFVAATAKIVGRTIEVSTPGMLRPTAVRYGWRNFFEPSLYNREGFSAGPFRTDAFKLKTQDCR